MSTRNKTLFVFEQKNTRTINTINTSCIITNRPQPLIEIYVNERQAMQNPSSVSLSSMSSSPLSKQHITSMDSHSEELKKDTEKLEEEDTNKKKMTTTVAHSIFNYELSMKTLLDCLGDEITILQKKFEQFMVKNNKKDPSSQKIHRSQLLRLLWECGLSHVTSTCLTTKCSFTSDAVVSLTFSDFLMIYAQLSGLKAQIAQVAADSTESTSATSSSTTKSSTNSLDKVKWFKLMNGHWQKMRMEEMVPLRLAFETYMVTTGVVEKISVEHATQALCPLVQQKYTKRQIYEEIIQSTKSNALLSHDSTTIEGHNSCSSRSLSFHEFCRIFIQLTYDTERAAAKSHQHHKESQNPTRNMKHPLTKPQSRDGPTKPSPPVVENKIKFNEAIPTRIHPLTKAGGLPEVNNTKNLVQALMKVDMDSAILLESSPKMKKTKKIKKTKKNSKFSEEEKEKEEKEEVNTFSMDSDAYSPISSPTSQSDSSASSVSSIDLDPLAIHQIEKYHTKKKQNKKRQTVFDEKQIDHRSESKTYDRFFSSSSDSESKLSIKKKHKKHKLSMYEKRKLEKQQRILRQVFTKYDVNDDGEISFIDLRRAFDHQQQQPHHRLSDLELHRWIAEKDRSGKGTVNFEDFVFAFRSAAVEATKEQLNASTRKILTAANQNADLVVSLPQTSQPAQRSITMTSRPVVVTPAQRTLGEEGWQQKDQLRRREEFVWQQLQGGKDSVKTAGFRLGGKVILDPEKKKQLTQLFQMYDRDQDGIITLNDLKQHFEERGDTNLREEDMKKWIQNKNPHEPNKQSVHLEEFLQAYK
jgi:Ca2+-binding EF-hand superfamily protein